MARKRTPKPTKKQIVALQLINKGMSARQAMLKAGYTEKTAGAPKQNLFKAEAVTSMVDKFKNELQHEGITTSYLAKKYAEWLDAHEVKGIKVGKDSDGNPILEDKIIPDYHTQLEAGKMLKDIYNLTPEKKEDPNLKRRITLEDFLGSPDQKPEN